MLYPKLDCIFDTIIQNSYLHLEYQCDIMMLYNQMPNSIVISGA